MGRPRKGQEKDRAGRVSFRIPVELDQGLRQVAEKRGSPMSDLVVEILEKGLRDAAKMDSRREKAPAPASEAPQRQRPSKRRPATRV